MIIDLSTLSPSRVYFTMIQTLIPRPIAWVLSDNGNEDNFNLAPFSYFNGVCSDPPLIMLSIGFKPDGSLKDTRKNIFERKEFVVHIAHRELAPKVTASSEAFAHGDSEIQRLGLETVPFGEHRLPRLKDCRVAYYCERYQMLDIGNEPQAMILGLVKSVYIDDSVAVLDEKNRLTVDAKKIDPLSRLGGEDYGLFGETITIKRPK